MPQQPRIRIGISGWQYKPWRGSFYPDKLPQRSELQYASAALPVIEINGSFYALQKPASYAKWYAETPQDFVFTVKGPRYITHLRRLKEVQKPLANFLASGLFNLREKLGAILWQFPPNFKYELARMTDFLSMLPRDWAAAAQFAAQRDAFMDGRECVEFTENRPLRYAVEIRHDSFLNETFFELLRRHNVAFVIAETVRGWPMAQDMTADFIYMRLHGDEEVRDFGYSDASLDRWAARIAAWTAATSRDVYCFFDGADVKLRAPFDSQALAKRLGVQR